MTVKAPQKDLLDTTSGTPSGKEMLYGKDLPKSIKKKYKEKELTESERLLRSQDKKDID